MAQNPYNYRWQQRRLAFLKKHPICRMCVNSTPSRIRVATVVDHVIPHKGDDTLFWDEANWQPLCKVHHDSHKKAQENATERGETYRPRLGVHADGWPK